MIAILVYFVLHLRISYQRVLQLPYLDKQIQNPGLDPDVSIDSLGDCVNVLAK